MRRSRSNLVTVAVIVVGLLVASACSSDDDDDDATSTHAGVHARPRATPETTDDHVGLDDDRDHDRAVPAARRRDDGCDPERSDDGERPAHGTSTLTTGDCTDSVAFTFDVTGADAPGYRVEYVPGPFTQDGSGEPVTIAGGAFVSVRFEPAYGYDFDTGEDDLHRTRPDHARRAPASCRRSCRPATSKRS